MNRPPAVQSSSQPITLVQNCLPGLEGTGGSPYSSYSGVSHFSTSANRWVEGLVNLCLGALWWRRDLPKPAKSHFPATSSQPYNDSPPICSISPPKQQHLSMSPLRLILPGPSWSTATHFLRLTSRRCRFHSCRPPSLLLLAAAAGELSSSSHCPATSTTAGAALRQCPEVGWNRPSSSTWPGSWATTS